MIPGQVSKPGVTVAVCTFNGGRHLPSTIAHILAQHVPEHIPWEVIIVDNASTDNTAEVATALQPEGMSVPYRVVHEPLPGVLNARKRALTESRYDFLCPVDDDTWIHSDFVRIVYDTLMEHPEVAVCGGDIEFAGHISVPDWFHDYTVMFAIGRQGKERGYVPLEQMGFWGAGMGLRKSAWFELQEAGFQHILHGRVGKKMIGGEDTELCMALLLAGWELWYEPDLQLKHAIAPERITWRYLRKIYRGNGASRIWLHIYRELLGLRKDKEVLPDRWQSLFFPELFRLLNRLPHAFMAWANVEGQKKALRYEARMGYLLELFRNRENYGKVVRELRSAPWIKRQLSSE